MKSGRCSRCSEAVFVPSRRRATAPPALPEPARSWLRLQAFRVTKRYIVVERNT
jgi:hypothetical protein